MLDGNLCQRWAKNSVWLFPIGFLLKLLSHPKAFLSHQGSYSEAIFSSIFLSICLGLGITLQHRRAKNVYDIMNDIR